MASGNACVICGLAEGLRFPSCCRNPICSMCMPNFLASQNRCATCRASLRGVQLIDAASALDLHRRIDDANAAERRAEEADGEEEDEAIQRTPQFQVIRSLIDGMVR